MQIYQFNVFFFIFWVILSSKWQLYNEEISIVPAASLRLLPTALRSVYLDTLVVAFKVRNIFGFWLVNFSHVCAIKWIFKTANVRKWRLISGAAVQKTLVIQKSWINPPPPPEAFKLKFLPILLTQDIKLEETVHPTGNPNTKLFCSSRNKHYFSSRKKDEVSSEYPELFPS